MIGAAAVANGLWFASSLPGERRFAAALDDPRREQEAILRRYVTRAANTVFGQRFGLADVRSIHEFQRRVPLHTYDDLAPDIDRTAAGEPNVLTPDPVLRLATSSGSTRARKLIPYTREFQRELDRAIGPWIVDLFRDDPDLMLGCAYWSITPVARNERPARKPVVPVGFEEDSAYLGGVRKRLVDAVMAVPAGVRHIGDIEHFRRATLDHLLRRRDLRLISVWHPSFLDLLLDAAGPTFDVARVWPNLRVVSCWADAHAAAPAAALGRRLPASVRVQPKGLLATEAFATIPYAGRHPVAVRSHFFEFLDDAGTPRLIDELTAGRTYGVVVTTAGGLWRYRLGDRVRVDGFVGATPSLRFVGRDDRVVDRFGEKLSDGFVGEAIRATLADLGVEASFAMLAADGDDRYTLYVESPAASLPPALAERFDQQLRLNPHYNYCRVLGQLGPVRVFVIKGRAYARYASRLQQAGMRLGDIKPLPLSERGDWSDVFEGRYADGLNVNVGAR
jgi:hypothetical protein